MMFSSPLVMMCGERGDIFCLQLLVPAKLNWYVYRWRYTCTYVEHCRVGRCGFVHVTQCSGFVTNGSNHWILLPCNMHARRYITYYVIVYYNITVKYIPNYNARDLIGWIELVIYLIMLNTGPEA